MTEILGTQPPPDEWIVYFTGGCALSLVVFRALWLPARNAITIAHEGGHGLVALATGRRLEAIRLHSDTSGLTVSRGRPTGLGVVLTLAAGYPAAPLLGLGGAALLGTHRVTLLLWIATVLLLALLVMVRNAYGILTVVLTSAASSSSPCWAVPRSSRPSPARRSGSCCSAASARPSNSRRNGATAAPPTRTQTSWRGSPMCPPGYGSSSSTRSRSAP